MATLQQPTNRPTSWERGPTNNYSVRSPADSDRGSVRNGDSIRSANENRGPPAMSKALHGMLKSTTETGDIGLFSIKPSRVPVSVNSPRRMSGPYNDDGMQRPRQFQPYGVPSIDDRQRLPSYARDASSEVISMYETASQKSTSRTFDDPDSRSYSMTQTYSSYSLSNHRSYTSLRSQPDAGGLLQRPRSPFAYPTRLKRPGFRPSSPALTDGGRIDYSRRAEIDRVPHGANHHTSSPASLYAQKRKPPLSLRPEANRSTPSLLSQSSPQRRSPSPRTRHRSGTPNNEWQRRNGPASINTSPARSTFSLASTVNLYQAAPAPSATTTPGKVPPSPLYYDYTEDFDIDEYNQPEVLEPPPQFRIEKTIPEDRPLSSDWASSDGSGLRGQKLGFSSGVHDSSSATSGLQKALVTSQDSSINSRSTSIFGPVQEHPTQGAAVLEANSSEKAAVNPRDTKIIRLSGLGLGARELSSHVEEVFGLPSSPSFEIIISDNTTNERKPGDGSTIQKGKDIETQSVRTSSYSLNTHLGQFPPPPRNLDGQCSEDNDQVVTFNFAQLSSGSTTLPLGRQDSPSQPKSHAERQELVISISEQPLVGDANRSLPPRSSTINLNQRRLSQPHSSDAGLTELDELMKDFEDANSAKNLREKRSIQDASKVLPAIPSSHQNGYPFGKTSSSEHFNLPPSTFNQMNGEIDQKGLSDQGLKRGYQRRKPRRLEAMTVPIESEIDIPNFSHQFPRKLISRSESPMLAPKPISPARQLKLKNSVPQLMKALPPLPPDPSIIAVSPPVQLAFSEMELPCRFSPLISESRATPPQEPSRPAEICSSESVKPGSSPEEAQRPVELDSVPVKVIVAEQVEEGQKAPVSPPPKLKLKMRSSATLRPTSPPESRPWNSEESYPWSTQTFNVGLPSVIQEAKTANPKLPKFKLKITRASNSTVGTVRINRGSAESKPSAGSHLRHTKDLFTPSSGIDNIFRQVSRHLHSRKASASSNHHSEESRPEPILASIFDQLSPSRSLRSDLSIPQESLSSLHATSPTEVHSFFSDESSHLHHGGRGLRKRFSNLRARITVPYAAANGTQSHDDITWRNRNGLEAPISSFSSSIPNIREGRASTEARPPQRLAERIHAQRLRAKFSVWFKGARSAIRARVRSRKVTGRGDDDELQLTGVV